MRGGTATTEVEDKPETPRAAGPAPSAPDYLLIVAECVLRGQIRALRSYALAPRPKRGSMGAVAL